MLKSLSMGCVATWCLLQGCAPALDTTREEREEGTLGEEIFRILQRDLKRDDANRALGLELQRPAFVEGIDHMFPAAQLDATQAFLVKLLPLYDDGTMPAATRAIAATLANLSADANTVGAMEMLSNREGYLRPDDEGALWRQLSTSPDYRALLEASLDLLGPVDGDQNGATESDATWRLINALSRRMANSSVSSDQARDIVLLADFMLAEDSRFASDGPGPIIAAVDHRGLAALTEVAPPFVDTTPVDQLADVDARGRFIDAGGAPIDLRPFSTTAEQKSAFKYIALSNTMLGASLRELRAVTAETGFMPALRVADAMFGARTADRRYDIMNSVALDLTHAVTSAMDDPALPEMIALARTLLEQHEAPAAWLLHEAQQAGDLVERNAASLRSGATFDTDLLDVVRRILEKEGLVEELLVAIETPEVRRMPAALEKLLLYKKDRVVPADVFSGAIFSQPVDRTAPDIRSNQSFAQRMLHLVYDAKGSSYEPRLFGIPLGFIFKIDDVSQFYLMSIIGEAVIPDLVSTVTGLSERPSPEELAVFLNEDQPFGNAKGREGLNVKDNDGDAAFALSASGLVNSLRPIVRVFHRHRSLPLLLDLLQVFHLHWATVASDYQDQNANGRRYSKLSGIRDFEPLLLDVMKTTKLVDATLDLLDETKGLRTSRGVLAQSVVVSFARHLVFHDDALLARDGTRSVLLNDRVVTPLSPAELFLATLERADRLFAATPALELDADHVLDTVALRWTQVEAATPETAHLTNRRVFAMVLVLLNFLEERTSAHERDRKAWLASLAKQGHDLLDSGEIAAVFDLIFALEQSPSKSPLFERVVAKLLVDGRGFDDLLLIAGQLLSSAKDGDATVRVARFAGAALQSEPNLLSMGASLMQKARAIDTEGQLLDLLDRSLEESVRGRAHAADLGRAIAQVNRVAPLEVTALSPADLQRIFERTASYLLDEEHGLEKLYTFVSKRGAGENVE